MKEIFYYIDDWQLDKNEGFIQSDELDALFCISNGAVTSISL
jgi:hypothetical protein